jgi:hypothetical protein
MDSNEHNNTTADVADVADVAGVEVAERPPFAVSVDPHAFAAAYSAVSLAASTDDSRPQLCNVAVEVAAGRGLRLIATDSYRLHVATIDADSVDVLDSVPTGAAVRFPAAMLKATEVRRLAKAAAKAPAGRIYLGSDVAAERLTDYVGTAGTVTVRAGALGAAVAVPAEMFSDYPSLDGILHGITGTVEDPTFDGLPTLNPRYLADVAKAGSFVADTISAVQSSTLKPNAWRASAAGVDLLAVLMPVRRG